MPCWTYREPRNGTNKRNRFFVGEVAETVSSFLPPADCRLHWRQENWMSDEDVTLGNVVAVVVCC